MNPVEYFDKKKLETAKAKADLLIEKGSYLKEAEELKEKASQAIAKKDMLLLRKLTMQRKEAEANAEASETMANALFDYDDSEVFEKWCDYVSDANKELAPELRKLRDMIAVTYTQLVKVLAKVNKAYATKHRLITMLHEYHNGATFLESYLLDNHAKLEVDDLKKVMTMFSDELFAQYGIDSEDIIRFNEWQIPYKEDNR